MAVVEGLPPPPPRSAPGSSSGPSEDERRRRAERDHRKREQAQRAAAEARSRQAEPSGRSSNWLKRETPFVCHIQFRNDLPEVPCEPKMLVDPLNPGQLAAFNLTTLEREPRRDLVLDSDLGIPLSVFDIERYSVPPGAQTLAPEDAALLEGDDDMAVELSPAMRVRQRLKGSKAELSWLMRTTYISNEMSGSQAKGVSEKQAKLLRDAGTLTAGRTREEQIAAIEANFEAAKRAPEHIKNRSLQPVEILPVLPDERQWGNDLVRDVLPDEELWGNDLVQVVFDGEPTADVPYLKDAAPSERRRYAEHAVAKPYRISVGDGDGDGFLAFMLPAEAPPPRASEAGPSDPDVSAPWASEETELRWIREYNYTMKQDEAARDFALRFGGDGRVTYAEMKFQLRVQTRRKKQLDSDLRSNFSKPSRVSIKRRAADEAEEAEQAKRLHTLQTGEEDYYVEEAETGAEDFEAAEEGAAAAGGGGNNDGYAGVDAEGGYILED